MSWKWFGSKSLYRWEAKGKPKCIDTDYDRTSTLVEERTVLIRARNSVEALEKALNEANAYCKDYVFQNCYGESVSIRFLKCCDVVELLDEPGSGIEMHSNNFITKKAIGDKSLVDRFLGKPESKKQRAARFRFMDAELVEEFALR